jgi:benzoyl-CoA reductase subunit BamC
MKRVNGKTIKTITIDIAKCNGCRACEVICAAFHAKPQYSSTNPARSRIRVIRDQVADIYLPIYAGEYTAAECAGRDRYIIGGREYDECAFCRASCPSRDFFKEPDSDLPLKCDMCESDPTITEPMCVQWCLSHALVYEEREVAQHGQVAGTHQCSCQTTRHAPGEIDRECMAPALPWAQAGGTQQFN